MAGPWFTVIECNNQWTETDSILISDGKSHVRGKIEIKVTLVDPQNIQSVAAVSDTASIKVNVIE